MLQNKPSLPFGLLLVPPEKAVSWPTTVELLQDYNYKDVRSPTGWTMGTVPRQFIDLADLPGLVRCSHRLPRRTPFANGAAVVCGHPSDGVYRSFALLMADIVLRGREAPWRPGRRD